jgi:signal transduction histidine kinase
MSGIKTGLEIGEGWKEMPTEAAKVLFRLLQEMLSNVARHSRATSVQVRFSADAAGYTLETCDDGVGIGKGKVDAQDSFGIIGMRESCASLGGSLAISGEAGRGCRVTAKLPRTPRSPK